MTPPTFPYDASRPLDLITMGRLGVDLYAEQIGSPLEEAQSFRKYLGGCPANIAVGSSRLGLKCAMLSRVGTDDMGKFLKNVLISEGVDTTLIKEDPEHLTALVILGVNPPDRFPLIFFRENCADMQIQPEDADESLFHQSKAFLMSGTCLSAPGIRGATHHAIQLAKSTETAVIFDIDYRPVLWKLTVPGDGESRFKLAPEVTAEIQKILPDCDLIVGTEEEILIAGGGEDLATAVKTIRSLTNAPIVQKRGEAGCLIFDSDSQQPIASEAFPVKVLNVLGAGDAFLSGFLRGWLKGESWQICGKYGNANGALTVSRHGCAPAMASFRELNYFIENYHTTPHILTAKPLALLHREPVLGHPGAQNLFVLGLDQQTLFEESCQAFGKDRSVISQFKIKVFEGLQRAKKTHGSLHAGLLIDATYGGEVLQQGVYEDLQIGMPIELPGAFPVEWLKADSLYQQILEIPSQFFVKIQWNYHPDLEENLKKIQLKRLFELSEVCQKLERRLLVEAIPPNDFETNGAVLAALLREVYEAEIYPFWWAIDPLATKEEWQSVGQILNEFDSDSRIFLLAQGTSMQQCKALFSVAPSQHTTGFVMGRTIFWELWEQLMRDEIVWDAIPQLIAERYLKLVHLWDGSTGSPTKDTQNT